MSKRTLPLAALMLLFVSPALASSHGAMPAGLSLWQMVVFQISDFVTHVSLAWEAIKIMFVSPSFGWAMLDGALCGDKTHLAHFAFDTATHALEAFIGSVLLAVLVLVEAIWLIRRHVMSLLQRPFSQAA